MRLARSVARSVALVALLAQLAALAHGQVRSDEEKLVTAIGRVNTQVVMLGERGLRGGTLLAQISVIEQKLSFFTDPAKKTELQKVVQAAKKVANDSRLLVAEGQRLARGCDEVSGVFLRTRDAPPGSDAARSRDKAQKTAAGCVMRMDAWLKRANLQNNNVAAAIKRNEPFMQ